MCFLSRYWFCPGTGQPTLLASLGNEFVQKIISIGNDYCTRVYKIVSPNQNMVLTFWHKRYPDMMNRWMDLRDKEFTQIYQTGPIDRGRFIVITVKNQ